jgi:hypothetical protein
MVVKARGGGKGRGKKGGGEREGEKGRMLERMGMRTDGSGCSSIGCGHPVLDSALKGIVQAKDSLS